MIRTAQFSDLESITEIYNQAIDARFQTGYTERVKVEDRVGWFYEHEAGRFPLFVYILEDKVVGWFGVSPYRAGRGAFLYTAEISYFIHKDYWKRGIASQLILFGVNACRQLHFKTVMAIILDKNIASMKLMEKFGFHKWAFLPGVADFDGVECSHIYYGMKLNEG